MSSLKFVCSFFMVVTPTGPFAVVSNNSSKRFLTLLTPVKITSTDSSLALNFVALFINRLYASEGILAFKSPEKSKSFISLKNSFLFLSFDLSTNDLIPGNILSTSLSILFTCSMAKLVSAISLPFSLTLAKNTSSGASPRGLKNPPNLLKVLSIFLSLKASCLPLVASNLPALNVP